MRLSPNRPGSPSNLRSYEPEWMEGYLTEKNNILITAVITVCTHRHFHNDHHNPTETKLPALLLVLRRSYLEDSFYSALHHLLITFLNLHLGLVLIGAYQVSRSHNWIMKTRGDLRLFLHTRHGLLVRSDTLSYVARVEKMSLNFYQLYSSLYWCMSW